ncbi:MAG: BamA/TamA family outer membrane protein [Robiginitalea sp.]
MKVRWHVLNLPAKIGLFLVGLTFFSCNVLKRVESDELLLTGYDIYADSTAVGGETINSFVAQKPNRKVLGIPLKLHLYNLAKPNPDSSYQDWLYRKDGRYDRLAALLSEKQVERLGESFFVSGLSNGLKRAGEPPMVVDSSLMNKTLSRLRAYYNTKGYFNNTGSFQVDSVGNQRVVARYDIQLGKPYFVDTLTNDFASPAVDSLYTLHRDESQVKQGDQFDLDKFTSERERLTEIFTIDSVNIFSDYTFTDTPEQLESVKEGDFTIFYKGRLRYKPKALTSAVFLGKGNIYRDIDRIRTYRQINNLNTFRYPNIEFVDEGDDRLTANIYLSPRPRNSLSLDLDITHSNIQRIGIGLGASLIKRNVFGGAETISLTGRGSFGLLSDESLPEDFFTEISADINLVFPRIWFFPFVNTKKLIPNYMLPQSRISVGTSFQKNIGLDKQTLNSLLSYTWSPNNFKRNIFELLNIEYVRNLDPENFFNVYQGTYDRLNDIAKDFQDDPDLEDFYEPTGNPDDPLRLIIPDGTTGFTETVLEGGLVPEDSETYEDVFLIEERRIRLTENNLIFAANFSYTTNNKADINDNGFHQFRFRVESAGNLLSALDWAIPFDQNENGQNLVFGVPYSEYIKTEVEYIKHWDLLESRVLAFRSFAGIAIPFGNSTSVPFVRSYFAGGSNDNRGWFPYSLGPGASDNLNDFNEANFKLAFNLEYRFPLFGDLRGAFFADVGNIWNIWDQTNIPKATFSGFESLKDIAVGSGFGLRYDFSFFVFRADLGFKTYNPARIPTERWFSEYNFANSILQIGINYPF